MSAQPPSAYDKQPLKQALESLAASAASNITGVDFASVSVRRNDTPWTRSPQRTH